MEEYPTMIFMISMRRKTWMERLNLPLGESLETTIKASRVKPRVLHQIGLRILQSTEWLLVDWLKSEDNFNYWINSREETKEKIQEWLADMID
jgi:hypothetical protein